MPDDPHETKDAWTEGGTALDQTAGTSPGAALHCDARCVRWQSVLDGMAADGIASDICALHRRKGDTRSLVYCDAALSKILHQLEGALDRPVHKLADWNALDAFCRTHGPGSVMCVCLAQQINIETFDGVIARQVETRSGVDIGIVSGVDLPGLEFSIAKLLRAPYSPARPGAVIDALNGVTLTKRGTRFASKDNQDSILSAPRSFVGLIAHGDGSHLKLPHTVVCGGWSADSPAGGCDGTKVCRRGGSHAAIPIHTIPAQVLLILSCGGFDLKAVVDAQAAHLVIAALEGHAVSLIASTRTVTISPEHAPLVESMLRAGETLGAVTRFLNGYELSRTGRPGFILLGDPELAVTKPACDPPGSHGRFWYEGQPRLPEISRITAGRAYATRVFQSQDRYGIVFNEPGAADLHITDIAQEVQRSKEALCEAQALGHWFKSVLFRLSDWSYQVADPPGFAADLAKMTTMRLELEQKIEKGFLYFANVQDAGCAPVPPADIVARIAPSLFVIQTTLWAVIARDLRFENVHELLLTGTECTHQALSVPCQHCERETVTKTYRARDGIAPDRFVEECFACGPLSTCVAQGLSIGMARPRYEMSLSRIRLTLAIVRSGAAADQDQDIHVTCEIWDKAGNVPIFETSTIVAPSDTHLSIDAHIESSLEADEYVVHAVAGCGAYLAFARGLVRAEDFGKGAK